MNIEFDHKEIENINLSFMERKRLSEEAALVGDTRINCLNPTMIDIIGGNFTMGVDLDIIIDTVDEFQYALHQFLKSETIDWFSKSAPSHNTKVDSFKVSKYLVTNKEFNSFYFEKFHFVYNNDISKSNHPAKNVSFEEAKEYCIWLNEKTNKQYRLLTEPEWEYIATNFGKDRFPWGNKKDGLYANTIETRINDTTAIGLFPDGFSENGIADLGGNVEEWVDTIYKPYPNGRFIKDRIFNFSNGEYNVLRGGCYCFNLDLCLGYRRHGYFPDYSISGFRICETI